MAVDVSKIEFPRGSIAEIARRYGCQRPYVRKGIAENNRKLIRVANEVLDEYLEREKGKAAILKKAAQIKKVTA
ncbi:MAG: hypothetical protein HUU10_10500 [Bacteroidetes bacterium]|nr:hypothetical protein [Bacteroidota bacterium]